MVALTDKVIFMRTRQDRLTNVRHLNLWGQEITDVSILESMINLEVLALPVNKITCLRNFQNCTKLRELYLRKNEIANLDELHYLESLKELRVLSLEENPCCFLPNYRLRVLQILPHLEKLDSTTIPDEEVRNAQLMRQLNITPPESKPGPSKTPQPPPPPHHQYSRPASANDSNSRYSAPPPPAPEPAYPHQHPHHTYGPPRAPPPRPENAEMPSGRGYPFPEASTVRPRTAPRHERRHTFDSLEDVPVAMPSPNGHQYYTPPHASQRFSSPDPPSHLPYNEVSSSRSTATFGRSISEGRRPTTSTSPGVINAIRLLLGELDIGGLEAIEQEVRQRMASFR